MPGQKPNEVPHLVNLRQIIIILALRIVSFSLRFQWQNTVFNGAPSGN